MLKNTKIAKKVWHFANISLPHLSQSLSHSHTHKVNINVIYHGYRPKKTNNWIMEKQIMDMFFFYNDENLCLFTMVNIGDDQLSLCHVIIFYLSLQSVMPRKHNLK